MLHCFVFIVITPTDSGAALDRFEEMRVFAAVAQLESFADAARQLALSPPRVTRAVAALEARLGVALLQRTTRQVRVTEAGRRYLEDAVRRVLRYPADRRLSGAVP